jgi:hypothetical protein
MVSRIKGLFITINQVIKFASATGQIIASKEIIEKRMDICRSCEFITGSKCFHCGCNLPIKVGLVVAECPMGKWVESYTQKLKLGLFLCIILVAQSTYVRDFI